MGPSMFDLNTVYIKNGKDVVPLGQAKSIEWEIVSEEYNQCCTIQNGEITLSLNMSEEKFERFKEFVLGIWDNEKGEKEMRNEVLELWYEREKNKLKERFQKVEKEMYENNIYVKEYNEIINNYEAAMGAFASREDVMINHVLERTGYDEEYKYTIGENVRNAIRDELREDYVNDENELRTTYATVKALLSISPDKDYQLKVLTDYDIIDKKGKML